MLQHHCFFSSLFSRIQLVIKLSILLLVVGGGGESVAGRYMDRNMQLVYEVVMKRKDLSEASNTITG
jgi:hypothetical protein